MKSRIPWRSMSMLAATLALLGGLAATSAAAGASPAVGAHRAAAHAIASSHPVCYGYTCHGHDPFVYGCGEYTSRSAGAYAGGTELAVLINWYGYCKDNFSLGYLTSAGLNDGDSIVIEISTYDSHGTFEFMCEPNRFGSGNTGYLKELCVGTNSNDCVGATAAYGGASAAWTDMVDGTNFTDSKICVFHKGTLVATGLTGQ
jgi:hypothetical protein